ncbi:MAG: hypothetical protein IKL70_05930 [Oscillospiraceae bacterium]|nr:hypothetical protein [Oscillospiraceae bacterium]
MKLKKILLVITAMSVMLCGCSKAEPSSSDDNNSGNDVTVSEERTEKEFIETTSKMKEAKGPRTERKDGTNGSYQIEEYDANDNRVKLSGYDADGTLEWYYTYEYDSNGKVIKDNEYFGDGALNKYNIFEYDSNGKTTKMGEYRGDGALAWLKTMEYDSNGELSKVSLYNSDSNLIRVEMHSNGDFSGKIEYEYNKNGQLKKEVEYDSNKYKIKQSHYNSEGILEYYYTYVYDQYGELAMEEKHTPDGTLV